MNLYVNKDDVKSICVVLDRYEESLTNEDICDLFENVEVPEEVQSNYGDYSYIDNEFVLTSIFSPEPNTEEPSQGELLEMKVFLISESSEVLLEYFEREKMIEMGLETDSTLTVEEFQSWSTYRNSLKNWDVSVDSTPPTL